MKYIKEPFVNSLTSHVLSGLKQIKTDIPNYNQMLEDGLNIQDAVVMFKQCESDNLFDVTQFVEYVNPLFTMIRKFKFIQKFMVTYLKDRIIYESQVTPWVSMRSKNYMCAEFMKFVDKYIL